MNKLFKTIIFILLCNTMLLGIGCSTSKEITINHVVNINEMEETPTELYIWINGSQYMHNTETNTTLKIQ